MVVYLCSCSELFYVQEHLKDHLQDSGHKPEHEYAKYGCHACLATFDSDNALWQHMEAKGHVRYLFECDICENGYRDQEACTTHEIEDHTWGFLGAKLPLPPLCPPKRGRRKFGTVFYSGTIWIVSVPLRKVLVHEMQQRKPLPQCL